MSRFSSGLAVAAAALLILPAAASARPGQRSFDQTYPIASKLCTNVAAGGGPIALRPDAAQVAALCGTLKTSFNGAQGTYFATVTPLKEQADGLVAQTRAACATRPSAICKSTRKANRVTLEGLRSQVRTAGTTYRATVEAGRTAFWNAIHGLRGGAAITADTGTPTAPTVTLPTTV
jgi:hypothetical protein